MVGYRHHVRVEFLAQLLRLHRVVTPISERNRWTMDTHPDLIESAEARRRRIRAGQLAAFEESLRDHLNNPPATWSVAKKGDRCWAVVDVRGTPRTAGRYTTKRAASEARDDRQHDAQWQDRTNWYLGGVDARSRPLEPDETAIVAQVVSEVDTDLEWVDHHGLVCRAELTHTGTPAIHTFDEHGFDVWGYDRDGHYASAYDRAPLQASPFPVRDEPVPADARASQE